MTFYDKVLAVIEKEAYTDRYAAFCVYTNDNTGHGRLFEFVEFMKKRREEFKKIQPNALDKEGNIVDNEALTEYIVSGTYE